MKIRSEETGGTETSEEGSTEEQTQVGLQAWGVVVLGAIDSNHLAYCKLCHPFLPTPDSTLSAPFPEIDYLFATHSTEVEGIVETAAFVGRMNPFDFPSSHLFLGLAIWQ